MAVDGMRPTTESDLAEIIRSADAPLSVRGGGTRGLFGGGKVLSTAGLSGVVLYEPGALTLVVQAGTPVEDIARVLAGERQRLAFEPPDFRGLLGRGGVSTIGGVVAANASGPRRVVQGAARDHALGVRFVDGRGTVVKSGGRVMKNVTGIDLVKLMAGSRGMLGVLSEVSLKVQPLPETEVTLVAPGHSPAQAVAAMSAALGSPCEVTGAAWAGGETLLRLEGFSASVAYRRGRLAALLGGDWGTLEAGESAARWRAVRDAAPVAGLPGALWRVHLKPSDAPAVLAAMGHPPALIDWGGALVWLRLAKGQGAALRAAVPQGHATRWQGEDPEPAQAPEAPGVAALTAGLRREFDPRGVFGGV
jgi:glycolate oxidase FAD binding subunit